MESTCCMAAASLAICASSGVFTQSSDQSSKTWTITDLGTLGGSESYANAINASGQVVGAANLVGDGTHAFLWHNGVMSDLGTLGGSRSRAASINTSGHVVGGASMTLNPAGAGHAFLWQNGMMTDLGTLGGSSSFATGINASGDASWLDQYDPQSRRSRISVAERRHERSRHARGNYSSATSINASGQIVGVSRTTSGTEHAFLWQDAVMTDLGTLRGGFSGAHAINASGQIVGYTDMSRDETLHAFLWQDGVMSDLGTLGGASTYALDINASGQVVGGATTYPFGDEPGRAFLWQDGVMTDLNVVLPPGSGWVLNDATGINDSGQIVGWGRLNGQLRAFLLTPLVTPTPDPSAPFGGAPIAVPGRIEAENYDHGAAGVAYLDVTAGNSGGAYRTDDVDIEPVHGSATHYNVGWMFAGDQLRTRLPSARPVATRSRRASRPTAGAGRSIWK